ATKATRPVSFRAAAARSGSSCWHGPHHEAKKLTTTGLPRKSASRTRPVPSSDGRSNRPGSVTLDGPFADPPDFDEPDPDPGPEPQATPAPAGTSPMPSATSTHGRHRTGTLLIRDFSSEREEPAEVHRGEGALEPGGQPRE